MPQYHYKIGIHGEYCSFMSSLKYTGFILGVLGGLALGLYFGLYVMQIASVEESVIGYFGSSSLDILGINVPLPIFFFIGPILILVGLVILVIYRPSPRYIERTIAPPTSSTNCRYCGYKLELGDSFCPKCNRSQT